jgi:hypothetical protein
MFHIPEKYWSRRLCFKGSQLKHRILTKKIFLYNQISYNAYFLRLEDFCSFICKWKQIIFCVFNFCDRTATFMYLYARVNTSILLLHFLRICPMKWLRYQRVISLETQVGITSQMNKWANTDPWTYRRWDQVPRRSKYPLSTGHIRCEPSSM